MKHDNNLNNLFENAGVGLFTVKLPERKIIDANARLAQILGYENLDRLFSDFSMEKHFLFPVIEQHSNSSQLDGTTEVIEMQVRRATGTIGWVNFSFGIFPKTGNLQGIIVDISERRRLEMEIVNISDLAKDKFGRDLHDILGQTLTGTAYICRALMTQLEKKPVGIEKLVGQIETMVTQAQVQARHLAHGLTYTEVKPNRVASHLKKLAIQINTVFEVECKTKLAPNVILQDKESATHLYRIAQEAINNAVKYSGSPVIEIRLKKGTDSGVLTIKDFGKGIPQKLSKIKGIGMRLMRIRARLIGASVRFRNKEGSGFQVICTFPLAKEESDEQKNQK